jgi:hypothetical protein
MTRIKMMGLCLVAVFAFAAVMATGASAKEAKPKPPKNITLSTPKGALATGAKIDTFSSNLIFETTAGNLECEENDIIGSVSSNDTKKDEGPVTEEISKGSFDGIPGACKTSATGPVDIVSSDLPWKVIFSAKGTGEVKGGPKIIFTSTFLALEPPNNKCTFEASKTKTTFGLSTTKAPITITTTKQTFKHAKKAANQSTLCPASGVLSGTFTGTSGGETLEDQLTA